MENKSLDQIINYSRSISEILSNSFIYEEELNYLLKNRKVDITKGLKKIIKENYTAIRNIQLKTIELPISENEQELFFYKNFILDINNRRNETLNLGAYLYSILYNKLHSNINTSYINREMYLKQIKRILHHKYDNIIEISSKKVNTLKTESTFTSFAGNYFNFEIENINELSFNELNTILNSLVENVENGKTLLFSNMQNNFSNLIIYCFLINKQLTYQKDALSYINYLCNLSPSNEKEVIFEETDIALLQNFLLISK
jgi:hypothetical protein